MNHEEFEVENLAVSKRRGIGLQILLMIAGLCFSVMTMQGQETTNVMSGVGEDEDRPLPDGKLALIDINNDGYLDWATNSTKMIEKAKSLNPKDPVLTFWEGDRHPFMYKGVHYLWKDDYEIEVDTNKVPQKN